MKNKYKILIGIAVLLIVIRLILPYVVLHYANKTLATMKGYYGHIEDIDLSIYRGAYIVNDIYLNKLDTISSKQINFFKSKDIDLSIDWGALLHGSIVGELFFDSPELIFTKDKTEWINTKLIFELSSEGNKTNIVFTHEGLVPEYECYNVCKDAWTSYIQGSLKNYIEIGKGKPNGKEGGLNAELVEKWGLPNK